MKHLRILFVVCVLVGVALLSISCASDSGEKSNAPPQVIGYKVGNTAPDFTLKDLDGKVVTLSSLRGKVVLVDFWDTWCPPCIEALPHLQELHMETKDQDIVIVAVAVGRKGESGVRSFIQKNGYTFTTVVGNRPVFESYNISGIPATYIIAPDGTIHDSWVGGKSKKEYEEAVHAAGSSH